jgi:hypothetical protein
VAWCRYVRPAGYAKTCASSKAGHINSCPASSPDFHNTLFFILRLISVIYSDVFVCASDDLFCRILASNFMSDDACNFTSAFSFDYHCLKNNLSSSSFVPVSFGPAINESISSESNG